MTDPRGEHTNPIVEAAEPTQPKPPVPEPPRLPPDDDIAEQSPELRAEMDRAERGEPPVEQEQRDDWPLPDEVDVASPYGPEAGQLSGDELANDERDSGAPNN